MSLIRGRTTARFLTGIAVAMAAGVLLTPSAAEAGCGHYVVVGGVGGMGMPGPDGSAGHESSDAVPVAPGGRPCLGPLCSQAPVAPSPAPATPLSFSQHDPLSSALAVEPADCFLSYLVETEAHRRPVRRPGSIYHPPRLS